jgi:hypothetical protein
MDINTFQLKMLGKSLLKLNYRRTGDPPSVSAHLCRPGHFQGHALRKGPGGRHHQPGPGHGRGSKGGEPGPRQGRRSGHLEGQTLRGHPGSRGCVHQRGKDLKTKAFITRIPSPFAVGTAVYPH